jgi:polygalacturonase
VTFTSNGLGTLEGNGEVWWGIPGIGYLVRTENRPRLFHMKNCNNTLIENFFFHNSPYWTFTWDDGNGLEIRHSGIDARRTNIPRHDLIDLTAFNTDGFDVHGDNVWIHDCKVWNQDDSFCVKGGSNMRFERLESSGLGLTIGSIGNQTVENITFQDITMDNSYKGIYLKFRSDGGLIKNVTY